MFKITPLPTADGVITKSFGSMVIGECFLDGLMQPSMKICSSEVPLSDNVLCLDGSHITRFFHDASTMYKMIKVTGHYTLVKMEGP